MPAVFLCASKSTGFRNRAGLAERQRRGREEENHHQGQSGWRTSRHCEWWFSQVPGRRKQVPPGRGSTRLPGMVRAEGLLSASAGQSGQGLIPGTPGAWTNSFRPRQLTTHARPRRPCHPAAVAELQAVSISSWSAVYFLANPHHSPVTRLEPLLEQSGLAGLPGLQILGSLVVDLYPLCLRNSQFTHPPSAHLTPAATISQSSWQFCMLLRPME